MTPAGKALWFIESHFGEPLSLDAVAAASGLSRFRLAHVFGLATGRPVAGYRRARRLSEAAKRLAAGASDILAVALDAGYGSHEAFTRAFRGEFGTTPETVRERGGTENLALTEPIRMPQDPSADLPAPRIEGRPALRLAGLRQFFPYSDTAGIFALWPRFHPFMAALPPHAPVEAFGVCLADPGRPEGFDYLAGAEAGGADLAAELATLTVAAATHAILHHGGHVSGVQATCAAVFDAWLPASGETMAEGPVTLVEHHGARLDPRSGEGGLDLWIPPARRPVEGRGGQSSTS